MARDWVFVLAVLARPRVSSPVDRADLRGRDDTADRK